MCNVTSPALGLQLALVMTGPGVGSGLAAFDISPHCRAGQPRHQASHLRSLRQCFALLARDGLEQLLRSDG